MFFRVGYVYLLLLAIVSSHVLMPACIVELIAVSLGIDAVIVAGTTVVVCQRDAREMQDTGMETCHDSHRGSLFALQHMSADPVLLDFLRLGVVSPTLYYSIVIPSILSRIMPRGIFISATSPTFLFSSPWAIGVLIDIFPSLRLASCSLTMV